ncbi:MAG: hypothetical protein ACI9DC_004623 [Gammaproteobacteria bacterium]|jgi:hypothetical protein
MNVLNTLAATSAAILMATTAMPAAADYYGRHGTRNYEVTITNASAVFFTPILAVAHKARLQLFEVGAAPSDALTKIAEGGDQSGYMARLALVPQQVGDVQSSGGLLAPGESVVIEMAAGRRFNRLSLAAMLLPTNDSFVAAQGVALPKSRGQRVTYNAIGYDAGSETNDELCAHIPGPQCAGQGESLEDTGEGYVRVSPGIQGVGDVSGMDYDWRNPVAVVSIKRVD